MDFLALEQTFEKKLSAAQNLQQLQQLKIDFLGRKGIVQNLMISLKSAPQEQRPQLGKKINDIKILIESCLNEKEQALQNQEDVLSFEKEALDVTLPGRQERCGSKHPIQQMLDQMLEILTSMGFAIEYGPEIESEYYNFESLNFPPEHPARDMQDTFYITSDMLLRTHTSNIQARLMESKTPPLRIAAPGRVYRNETITYKSHVFFHQIEAFYVDKKVTFTDLIQTLEFFFERLFNEPFELRFRPSYFPFVEPGMEVDIRFGKGKWLEVLGAGMIHPEVLINGGISPEEYTGFAWGMGVERLLLLKSGIEDIRILSENDLRFLKQFPAL